jgi:hypothetical protein
MSVFIGEQAFARLQIRKKMSYRDGTRTTNLVMACNLMFLYSNYRLIGIAHQQAMNPMTEQEANEKACLLNGLFNADLSGYDFLTTSDTAADDAIDRYQDFQKLKDKICDGLYLKKEVIDEFCKVVEATFRFPDFAIQKYFPITSICKAIYVYVLGDADYLEMTVRFEHSYELITKEPMTGADVRKVFIMLRLLLDKYWEVAVDYDMSQTIIDKKT